MMRPFQSVQSNVPRLSSQMCKDHFQLMFKDHFQSVVTITNQCSANVQMSEDLSSWMCKDLSNRDEDPDPVLSIDFWPAGSDTFFNGSGSGSYLSAHL